MKTSDDALQFAHQRLRQRGAQAGPVLSRQKPRITRRIALRLGRGQTERVPNADETVVVSCTTGTLWITHDGDPRDLIVWPRESYRAERGGTMHVFALEPSVLEIEFEDDADVLH